MKLIYLYIGNNQRVNDRCEINFSSDFSVHYEQRSHSIVIHKLSDPIKVFKSPIIDLKAIIGRNGCGKSTILDMLYASNLADQRNISLLEAEDAGWFSIYYIADDEASKGCFFIEEYAESPFLDFVRSSEESPENNNAYYFIKYDFGSDFIYNWHYYKDYVVYGTSGFITEELREEYKIPKCSFAMYNRLPLLMYYYPVLNKREWYVYKEYSTQTNGLIPRNLLKPSAYMLLKYSYEAIHSMGTDSSDCIKKMFGSNPRAVTFNISFNGLKNCSTPGDAYDIKQKEFVALTYSPLKIENLNDIFSDCTDKEWLIKELLEKVIWGFIIKKCDIKKIETEQYFEPFGQYFDNASKNAISKTHEQLEKRSLFCVRKKVVNSRSVIVYLMNLISELCLQIEDNSMSILSEFGITQDGLLMVYAFILLLGADQYKEILLSLLRDIKEKRDMRIWNYILKSLYPKEQFKFSQALPESYIHKNSGDFDYTIAVPLAGNSSIDSLFGYIDLFEFAKGIGVGETGKFVLPSIGLSNLSTGEIEFVNLFASLYGGLANNFSHISPDGNMKKEETCIILLDEPDSSFHPEWSRRFINTLNKVLQEEPFSKYPCMYQVILTTHSPIILSDMPKDYACLLELTTEGNSIVKPSEYGLMSNINDIMVSSFFVARPFGEFAETYVNELMSEIRNYGKIDNHFERQEVNINTIYSSEYETLKRKIEIISEPYVKKVLMNQLDEAVSKNRSLKRLLLQKKIEELQLELEKMEG